MSNWSDGPKKSLSPEDVLRIAFAHLLCDVHQHTLASMWGMDSGRVAEAVVSMRWAAENHKVIYRHITRVKKAKKASLSQPLKPADNAGTTKFLPGIDGGGNGAL